MQLIPTSATLLFAILLSTISYATKPDSAESKPVIVLKEVSDYPDHTQDGIRKPGFSAKDFVKNTSKKIAAFDHEHRALVRYGIIPIALTTVWYGTYKGVDAELQDESQEVQHSATSFVANRLEPFGRSRYMLPAFGGVMAYGLIAKSPRARKTAVIGVSALLINNMVTGNLKAFFNRHRPNSGSRFNTWDGPEGANGQNHSFPSSHTSTAFAVATVFATSYKDRKWVPVVAYTGATLVGMSRIYQDHHWASDVLAGAVVGILTAKGTYAAYNFIERKLKVKKPVVLLPQFGPGRYGLTASLAF